MEIKEILNKAFSFGQTYWQQADSEHASQHKKADLTLDRFNEFSLAVEIDMASAKFRFNETEKQRNDLLEALEGIMAIVNDSRGVAGYHLNGNTALWEEFNEIDAAIAAIAAARGNE